MRKIMFFLLSFILSTLLLSFAVRQVRAIEDCNCIPSFMCAPGEGSLDCYWFEFGVKQTCQCCNGCAQSGCFTGDTPVRMADDSEKPIEEVEVGEMVKSFDSETGEITESEVTKVYEHSPEETSGYYILTTESGRELKVTPEHPILAEKTSETMSPLELTLLKLKAALLKLLGRVS